MSSNAGRCSCAKNNLSRPSILTTNKPPSQIRCQDTVPGATVRIPASQVSLILHHCISQYVERPRTNHLHKSDVGTLFSVLSFISQYPSIADSASLYVISIRPPTPESKDRQRKVKEKERGQEMPPLAVMGGCE
jgi:hypothetical protein